jgi:hypothetical protein
MMHAEHHLHFRLQIGGLIANQVPLKRDLVVSFRVHEMKAFTVAIEVGEFAVFDVGALDLLGGLVALGHLHAVADAAHVNLRRGRALAGVEALGVHDDVELLVNIEDIALSERAGDDLHRCCPFCGRRGRAPHFRPAPY